MGNYSYILSTKHNGKKNQVAGAYTAVSKVYSGKACSGSVVMEEDVTYKWTDYSVVTQYHVGFDSPLHLQIRLLESELLTRTL